MTDIEKQEDKTKVSKQFAESENLSKQIPFLFNLESQKASPQHNEKLEELK